MQTKQPLFQTDYVLLEYLPDWRCLRVEWNGFVRSEQYKEGLDQLLAYYKQLPVQAVLIDQRKRKVLQKEGAEWLQSVWFPQFHAALNGSVRFAFINSEDVFGRATSQANTLEIEKKYQQNKHTIEYRYFDDLAVAYQWLGVN